MPAFVKDALVVLAALIIYDMVVRKAIEKATSKTV